VTEVLTTGSDELTVALKAARGSADFIRQVLIVGTAGDTLRMARESMRQIELRRQEQLLRAFVERARNQPLVLEVWATHDPSLDVTVVVAERDLEAELRLYAIFREVAAAAGDKAMGDLAVLPAPFEPEGADLHYRA
jgi:hypothetical protein